MVESESVLAQEQGAVARGKWSLPGDGAWWMFLTAEFGTLCMFFVVFAFMRSAAPEEFKAAQALLDPRLALANSLILMTSGYCMARGLHSMRIVRSGASPAFRWVLAAALLGIVFVVIKSSEYGDKFELGLTFSSGTFWFFYFFLTGFHYLHVLLGIGFLFWIALRVRNKPLTPELQVQTESCGAFWHMLDLVWILLFPLLYLL
ncbi:MAG: cytochrome c oxidase subunit 3 family protein [bacterium]|nr:cytochrome c oxidase subunit 3 family protein [bacterium]